MLRAITFSARIILEVPMEKMILVADDSLTIQKVIKITLSEHPFKLEESRTEADLFEKVKRRPYDLILLDFGLSESKSGYELGHEIKKLRPDAKVIALLGTFDSVDESEVKKIGFAGSIVKPFESGKFTELCTSVLDGSESVLERIKLPPVADDLADDLSGWDHKSSAQSDDLPPVMEEDAGRIHLEKNIDAALAKDELGLEMEDWGLAVPPPIGDVSFEKSDLASDLDLPGIISESDDALADDVHDELEATASFDLDKIQEEEVQSVPVGNDLEYPGVPAQPKSKLVSMAELAPDDLEELEYEDDETDPAINTSSVKETRTGINLQAEILAEGDPDNFWAVDDGGDQTASSKNVDQGISAGSKALETVIAKTVEPQIETKVLAVAPEAVAADLFEKVKPLLDKLIADYCKQKTEEVAWEVIPDLAENLIRQEIKSISASLQ